MLRTLSATVLQLDMRQASPLLASQDVRFLCIWSNRASGSRKGGLCGAGSAAPGRPDEPGTRPRASGVAEEGTDRGRRWLPTLPGVHPASDCLEAPLPLSQGGDAREAGPVRRTAGKRQQEKVHNGAFHRQPVARCQDRLRGGQHAGVGLPCALPRPPVPCLPPCWGARRPLPLLLLLLLLRPGWWRGSHKTALPCDLAASSR